MLESIQKQWQAKFALILFLCFTIFWIFLQMYEFPDNSLHKLFGALYGIMALWGGFWGIIISKKWGFTQSIMGKAILMFALGLFAQEFGQITLSFYDYYLGIQGSYPSLGDVGFFGSIPLYIYGAWLLGQASGMKFSFQLYHSKVQAIVIPLIMLMIGYFLFLQNYEFDWSNPIKTFLDFGYPFGQAIYISLAILAYSLSKNTLGGIMKNKIFFILFALFIQFLSDYTFLYQSSHGTWQVGGINDYMYFVSYFLMTFGLLQLETVLTALRNR